MEQTKRTLYFTRTETKADITIIWKPFANLSFLVPLAVYILFGKLTNASFVSIDTEFIFALIASLGLISFPVCAIVQFVKCKGVSREIKAATAAGAVSVSGSKYSFSNPLRVTIQK